MFDAPPSGQHVRPAGEDVKEGQVLVAAGKRVGPPELGLLANAGFPHPTVHPRPRVIVLSTGDELIPPTETPSSARSATRMRTRSSVRFATPEPCRCSPAS